MEGGLDWGWREKRKEIAFTKSAEFKLCQCLLRMGKGVSCLGAKKSA